MRSTIALAGLVSAAAAAGRPANESICDYYTTALLKDNTAANQQTLLTLVVNTAVIGNYTKPNVGIAVPGILTPGTYMGEKVNLLPYFSGMLASTNNGGSSGVSVNFLDGGGATPLMNNMAANNTNSAQYTLLTHLYEYFANLLGCTEYGVSTSPYNGDTSMYSVHKYMALDNAEVNYFIQQVGLSAASFGVADSDVAAVGKALSSAFGMRCAPPVAIPTSASPALQAICIASDCPVATPSDCSDYAPVVTPTPVSGSASMSMSAPAMTSASMMPSKNATMSAPAMSSPAMTSGVASVVPSMSGGAPPTSPTSMPASPSMMPPYNSAGWSNAPGFAFVAAALGFVAALL